MITFYVDTDKSFSKFKTLQIDLEFYLHMKNYLKLVDNKGPLNPWGYMSSSELQLKLNNLPHEWLLAKPELKQMINNEEIIVQRKFSEEYILELKEKLMKLVVIAKKHACLIRWE